MSLIFTIHESDVHAGAQDIDSSGFKERRAARAVVFDSEGKAALLKVGDQGYHKLPGGGIDEDETVGEALDRELMEEIGCTVKVTENLGEIVEYRDRYKLKQTSYCFVAEQYGEIKQPEFTEDEIADGFEMVWADNIDQAIEILENSFTEAYEGKFIVMRDLKILKLVKEESV